MKGDRNGTNDFIADVLQRPLEVVFQDEHYVAVYKPAGLMVHRGSRTCATEPILLQALRDQLGRFLYPIHRLDRPTAGVVVFGLTREAASRMGELFAKRRIAKHYQALVRGTIDGERTVDHLLIDSTDEPRDTAVVNDAAVVNDGSEAITATESRESAIGSREGLKATHGQTAVTRIRSLRHFEVDWPTTDATVSGFTLLEVQPITGRWHQIRRHLSMIGHPVIGDYLHGDHEFNQNFVQRTGVNRMLLTAMRLEFRHPYTDEPISILVSRGEAFDTGLGCLDPSATTP